jgi:hypothetical protein
MRDQAAAIALRLSRRARKKAEGGAVEDELIAPPRTPSQLPEAWNQAVRTAAKRVLDTASAPGRALQGGYGVKPEKPGLWSEEDEFRASHAQQKQVEDATNLSLDVAQARFPFAKSGEAGIFGGKLAKTADHAKLAEAEELTRRGFDPDIIRRETGWFQGADKKWRFEIPDYQSKLKPDRTDWRSSYANREIEHPELFKAYPELQDIGIRRSQSPDNAYYQPRERGQPSHIALPSVASEKDRSLMLHELQHAVQRKEGFSPGTSTKAVRPVVEEKINEIERRIQQTEHPTVPDIIKKSPDEWTPQEVTEVQNFYKKLPDKEKAVWETYARHAGEVESRNVERRMDFTPQQIREQAPWKTEDRARNKQIVLPQEDGMKRGGSMQRTRGYAAGGASKVPGPSFFQRDANRALSRQSGLIKSVVPGRTDKHPMRVASGSYIIPADVVSHLGQNNTLAGAKFLKRKFGGGGVLQFADGGEVPMPVPIIAAGGEYVLSPEQVASVGKGDMKAGHDKLDRMVLDTRKHHIKTLRNLAPPKRS